MIWEPFILALVLGIIVSAGLYFAYLWPSVEPSEEEPTAAAEPDKAKAGAEPAGEPAEPAKAPDDKASAST